MYYLAAFGFLLVLFLMRLWKLTWVYFDPDRREEQRPLAPLAFIISTVVLGLGMMLYGVPFAVTESSSDQTQLQGELVLPATTAITFLAIGSVLLIVALSIECLHAIRAKSLGFWKTGQIFLIGCAALIGLMSTYTHSSFVGEDTGFLNIAMIADQVEDVDCDSPLIFLNWDEGYTGPTQYRCPTSVVMLWQGSQAFLPWPSYEEGRSADLTVTMEHLVSTAKRIED